MKKNTVFIRSQNSIKNTAQEVSLKIIDNLAPGFIDSKVVLSILRQIIFTVIIHL